MQLKDTDFGWCVATDECRLGRIEIDFRLCLLLADHADTATVCIETACRLSDGDTTVILIPADPSSVGHTAIFQCQGDRGKHLQDRHTCDRI